MQESAIRAYIKAGSTARPAWPKPLADSDPASLEVRRSGVLVALVSGDAIPDESHRLIELVHFEANLTAMGQPQPSEIQKTATLLMGIAGLRDCGFAGRHSAWILPRRWTRALSRSPRQTGLIGV